MSCKYPEHHRRGGPSAAQPVALLIVIALVAIVVTHWRAVVACIVSAGVLMAVAAVLMTLSRNHARHYDPELDRQAALERAQAPAVPAPAPAAALEPPPAVVHQHLHLHLHGLSDGDMADVVRKAIGPGQRPPW